MRERKSTWKCERQSLFGGEECAKRRGEKGGKGYENGMGSI